MNNKYNVRAIRDELDTYIRCNAWNKFRKRFVSLLSIESNDGQQQQQQRLSLCRAVIEYINNKCSFNNYNKGNNTTGRNSLLHVLCRRFNSSPEHPVPMDMIELIGQTCPKLFAKSIISDVDTPAKSPFMILLDRGAPPFLIERIIQILYDYDKNNHNARDGDGDGDDNKIKPISKNRNKNTKNKNNVSHPSLVMQCLVGKDSKGNTPLLHAIKYQDCPDMLRTLVEYDKYGQSLLITSKKGQIPLYYLVQQAMRELGQYYNISSRTTTVLFDTTQLPENLVYMLRKTQRAIYVEQHGTSHNFDSDSEYNRVEGRYDDHDVVDDDDNECHDYDFNDDGNFNDDDNDDDDNDNDNGLLFERSTKYHQSVDSVLVFQAAICCVQYLNERHRVSLFRWLLMLLLEEDFTAVDNDGNTYHHLICYAHESQCFIDDDKYEGDNNMTLNCNNNNKNNSNSNSNDENNNNSTSLLQFLTSKHPESLSMYNNDGKIPLHVGIEQKKDWKYLEYLIRLAPESGRIPTTRTVTTTTTRHMRSWSHSPLSSFSREKQFQQYQQQSQQLGGQLPLHLVLLQYNGGSCDDHRRCDGNKSSSASASNNSCNASIHTTTETTTNTYYNAKEIIIGLWKIYPEAALMKDPTTNLYPFQSLAVASVSSPSVAASSSSSPSSSRVRGDGTKRKNNGRKSRPSTNTISGSIEQTTMMMTEMIENQSKEQLSLVYEFLRQAPEVLQFLI